MSNSKHIQIRDAMVAVLLADPPLAGGNVSANRRIPMARQDNAKVFVYLESAVGDRGAIRGAPIDWNTLVRTECVARDVPGTTADDAADALAVQVFDRLSADIGLGGLLQDLYATGMEWGEEEADTTVATCQLQWAAQHRTQFNTIGA